MKKGGIVLHLLIVLLIQFVLTQTTFGAPAQLAIEDDAGDSDVFEKDAEGRTFGQIFPLNVRPFRLASGFAHRLGYWLDPAYLALNPGFSPFIGAANFQPGLGFVNVNAFRPDIKGTDNYIINESLPYE